VLESEPTISYGNESKFLIINYIFGFIFLVEYICRLYAVGLNPQYSGFLGRIKYIFSFYAVIDLISFAPFLFFPAANESFLLRLFRMLRLFSLLKTSRHASGLILIGNVVINKKYELMFSILLTFVVIFILAICLYLAEGGIYPEAFGSIPRALWWSSVTLTTVGYGDIVPISVLGKILTILITIASIGIVAIPTGILAAGFSEALSELKNKRDN
tara:strand:- start:86 stop:730 length:645 start_codon:yes stop_codon:yes gene_type:complete